MNEIIEIINKIAKSKNINTFITASDLEKTLRELNIDSLAAMTLIIDLENELNITIPDEKLTQIKTLKDLIEIIQALKKTT